MISKLLGNYYLNFHKRHFSCKRKLVLKNQKGASVMNDEKTTKKKKCPDLTLNLCQRNSFFSTFLSNFFKHHHQYIIEIKIKLS